MTEELLYQDAELKIGYSRAPYDHYVWIRAATIESEGGNQEGNIYDIPRGILEELARVPRGELELRIQTFNSNLLFALKESGIGVDGLHVAICQAYAEEERRVKLFVEEGLKKK